MSRAGGALSTHPLEYGDDLPRIRIDDRDEFFDGDITLSLQLRLFPCNCGANAAAAGGNGCRDMFGDTVAPTATVKSVGPSGFGVLLVMISLSSFC